MANHISHASLPYPIFGAKYTLLLPYLDADGDPTDPVTPDTEICKDPTPASQTFTDTTNEITILGTNNGAAMLTLDSTEMSCTAALLHAKVASGPKNTLAALYPRRLPTFLTTTISAVSAGPIFTLATFPTYDITNCFVRSNAGGGTDEARRITGYNSTTGAFTVSSAFEDTSVLMVVGRSVSLLLPEGVTFGMLTTLRPTDDGRRLNVTLTGAARINLSGVENQSAINNWDNTRVRLHTDYDLYHAELSFVRDQSNTRDEYTVVWFFDGQPLTTGVTSPTIQLVKRADGTDLLPETALTQIGSSGYWKHDETTNRVVFGEAVIPIMKATIDGAVRTFIRLKGLDSV